MKEFDFFGSLADSYGLPFAVCGVFIYFFYKVWMENKELNLKRNDDIKGVNEKLQSIIMQQGEALKDSAKALSETINMHAQTQKTLDELKERFIRLEERVDRHKF